MEFTKEMAEQQISWAESHWQQVKADIWLSLLKACLLLKAGGGEGAGSDGS